MTKYISNRQQNLKIGIVSYTENKTVLEVIGKVGIGTTNPTSKLTVVGDVLISGILTAANIVGTSLSITGISTIANFRITNVGTGATVGGIGVTYYGDGSNLTGKLPNTIENIDTNKIYYPLMVDVITGTISTISVSSNSIVFNPGTDSLGIGTTNPRATLNVVPTSSNIAGLFSGTTSSDMVRITQLGTGNALVVEDSTNPDATPFVVRGDGSVGIGTNNPTVALQLSPNASISNVGSGITLAGTVGSALTVSQFYYSNTNTSYLRIKATRNTVGSDWLSASTKLVNITDVTEQGYIEYNPNGALYGMAVGSGATEWARFLQNGNLGIGRTNPSSKLEVLGTIAAYSADTTSVGSFAISNAGLLDITSFKSTGGTLRFITANSSGTNLDRGRVDSSGNFIIGAATSTGTASQPLQVTGGAYVSGNLGIGTTNPTSKLTVQGDVLVSGILTASSIVGTSLSISGISTIANFRITNVGTGATVGGIGVTYYGDGSNLTGKIPNTIENIDINRIYYPLMTDIISGIVTTISVSSNSIVFNPGTDSLGIGTTNPTSKLTVIGDISASTTLTAPRIVGTSLSITGISTIANFRMSPVGTGATVGGIGVTYYGDGRNLTNIVSSYATNAGIATNVIGGIASVTSLNVTGITTLASIVGTSLSITGISTIANFRITNVGTGATVGGVGVLTYYGDGSQLTGLIAGVSISTNTANQSQLIPYVTGTGSTTGFGVTTLFTYNPSSGNLGIGTTTPTSKLTVVGDVLVSGILTASSIVGTSLSITGISTFGGNVNVGTGITMYASTGIISATAFYGNGQNLSDIIAAKLAGITVLEENTLVGTAYQFSELKFVGSYVTATGIGSTATITFTTPESVIGGIASVTSLNVTGISTLGITSTTNLTSQQLNVTGILTASSIVGTSLSISGISTFTNGPILVGAATSTGTTAQPLQVTGGAYVSGNLGIGTTNPTSKLHVIGDVRVSGASTFGGIVELDNALRDIYGNVGAAGSVLLSTVSGVSWSPSAAVSIANTTTNAIHYVGFGVTSTGTLTTLNVNTDRLQFNPSSGTLSATVFTSLSDRTQKEDIRPIENAIGIVNQLTGVRYNWKNNTNKPSIGLIAQDVEEVIPEVVVEMADGLKSVSYGNIVAVLIEAIKEQQVRIEELEDRLNA